MDEKFLRPIFCFCLRRRAVNPPPHPVPNIVWKPLEELAEAVRDDEPIVTNEMAVLKGVCVVMKGDLFHGRFIQKYLVFSGIDHLRNLQVPAKS